MKKMSEMLNSKNDEISYGKEADKLQWFPEKNNLKIK